MNRLQRLLSWLMILLTAAALVSCNDEPGEVTTDETTAAAEPVETILSAELSNYKFIYPEEHGSAMYSAFLEMRERFDAAVGSESDKGDDFYYEGVSGFEIQECEILIGITNRPESQAFVADMRADDYGYAVVGKKLVIAGRTEAGTIKALSAFTDKVIARYESDGSLEAFASSKDNYLYTAEYAVDSFTLGGVDIREFTVVYPKKRNIGEDIAAERIANEIAESCGYVLDVVREDKLDDGVKHVISVGITGSVDNSVTDAATAAGKAFVGFDGQSVLVYGVDSSMLLTAAMKFADELGTAASAGTRDASLSLDTAKQYETADDMLTAMSFNHLCGSKTSAREQRVIDIVMKYMPDTIGFQETTPAWLVTLKNSALKSIYAHVGEGRDGGNSGEYNPIFYNKSKFELKESGTRWLSDTPEVVSKYYSSSLNRIYTYALLERKSDGKCIMVINTHLDHVSEEARNAQIKVLLAFVEKYREYPIVLTGDFNSNTSSSVYSTVTKSFLKDSADVAMHATRAATFTSFGTKNATIDFVFVSPELMSVTEYSVCNEMIDGEYPSDHHPVLIKYSLG